MPSPANKPSAATAKKSSPKPEAATAATPARAATAKATLTPAERMKMIAEAAYYLAEKRGFSGGNELTDWVAAEKQVDSLLAKRG